MLGEDPALSRIPEGFGARRNTQLSECGSFGLQGKCFVRLSLLEAHIVLSFIFEGTLLFPIQFYRVSVFSFTLRFVN